MENKKLSYEELEAKLKELEQENAKLKTINSIFKDREQSEKYVWMHQQFKLRDFYLENKYWFLRLLDSKVVQKDNVISIENVNGNFPIYLTEEERRSAIQDLAKYIDQKTYQFDTNPKIDYLYTVFDNLCSLYITHGLICNGGIKENIMQMRGIREFSYDSYLPFYHDFAAIYKALEKIEDDEIKMEIIEKLIPIVVSEVYADNKSLRAVERDGIMYHLNDRANFENWAFRRAESGKNLENLKNGNITQVCTMISPLLNVFKSQKIKMMLLNISKIFQP